MLMNDGLNPKCPAARKAQGYDLDHMKVSEEMVSRFLSWKLPKSVRPDSCVMNQDYPDRIGTHLLTADEARQMLTHVLVGESPGMRMSESTRPRTAGLADA